MVRRPYLLILCTVVMVLLLYMSYNMTYIRFNKAQDETHQKTTTKKTFVKTLSEKFSSYFDLTERSIKKEKTVNRYLQDEYMFGNIKKVEDIVAEARKEIEESLNRRQNKIIKSKLPKLTSTKHTITPLPTELIKSRPEVANSQAGSANSRLENNTGQDKAIITEKIIDSDTKNIRTNYKYEKPSPGDLSKLITRKSKLLELAADPLSISARCNEDNFLIVLVMSHPDSRDRRDKIRNSWGYSYSEDVDLLKNAKKFKDEEKFNREMVFRIFFVMGKSDDSEMMKSVYEEGESFKDIVYGDLIENYKNLTLKTRLALKWAYYDCKSVYVIKTDDDVFINPVPLVEWLKDKPRRSFYTGYCNSNSPVVRNRRNKWFVSYEEYAKDTYPTYCLGGGYLLSSDVLGAFLRASYGRYYFPMEDLYVGLIIDEMKSVKPRDERKHFDLIYGSTTNDCDMNSLFLAHRVLGDQLKRHRDRARLALEKCSMKN